MNKSALGIMFRVPEYGKVKKRLAAQIGDEKALKAYSLMLSGTINNISSLKDTDIYGFYEGATASQQTVLKRFQSIPQQGKELGERMYNAIQWLFDKRYEKVALIGSDSPDLPSDYIKDAFLKLNSYELVIGPSEDGGYYLIGMTTPLDTIFKSIPWGTAGVLKGSILKAEKAGIRYFLLPQWYDIDDVKDLQRWNQGQ